MASSFEGSCDLCHEGRSIEDGLSQSRAEALREEDFHYIGTATDVPGELAVE